jgi:hypothetical protein
LQKNKHSRNERKKTHWGNSHILDTGIRRSDEQRQHRRLSRIPKGKPLVTLRDAANYITKLPKAEHETE